MWLRTLYIIFTFFPYLSVQDSACVCTTVPCPEAGENEIVMVSHPENAALDAAFGATRDISIIAESRASIPAVDQSGRKHGAVARVKRAAAGRGTKP